MKSENITSGRQQKATAAWVNGVNSVRNPWTLPDTQFKWGVNVNCRGGMVQTRSGFKMKLSLPAGNFQGGLVFSANKQASPSEIITDQNGNVSYKKSTIYTPQGTAIELFELTYMVFAVDGKVYYAPFPLTQPKSWEDYRLVNISLNPDIDRVSFVVATQSATINSGNNVSVTPSHRLIVVQDGINQPYYWDGSDTTGQVASEMPIGFWMSFSGNRLWVANGNIISASDLANPLGWEERKSGAGRGDFSVPRPITAMQDYVGQNNDTHLYVFTDRATYSLASGILDRSLWATTPNFQNTLFANIGCIAGRSITFQAGLMWWYSQDGLVSIDVATSSYLSSQVLYKDVEMAKAKRLMSSNIQGICATSFENYLLCSIPYFENANSATMVLDYAVAAEWNSSRTPAWAGVWTGIRPVDWANAIIDEEPKLFAFSIDYAATSDGSFNHVWEAFVPERYDTYLEIQSDGSTTEHINRIYCQMETAMLGDSMDLKQMVYSELDCSQIAGEVDVKVSFRGSRGAYQEILNTRVLAATDSYQYATSNQAYKFENLGLLQTQSRRLITENVQRTAKYESCESKYSLDVDKAFSLLIEWCGAFGLDSIRMFLDPFPDASYGRTSSDEKSYCVIGEDGSSIVVDLNQPTEEKLGTESTSWTSSQTRTARLSCNNGSPAVSATATASYRSYISLDDAVTQAAALATNEATIAANQYRTTHPC
jgi:hypothetical protein